MITDGLNNFIPILFINWSWRCHQMKTFSPLLALCAGNSPVSHEKKIGHRDCSPWAHRELTVSSRWPKWSQPAVTEPWPGPWLSCDPAVTEPWSYWRCRDWAVTLLWLSCELAVTELWPSRDWAVTSPSRDWAVIIGSWLSCDLAVTEPWSYWRCRDWAVTLLWLSCDLAVTELWPRRDWAVTSPSRDWAVIIGPGAVTTVVTVSWPWAHRELTVTIFYGQQWIPITKASDARLWCFLWSVPE